MSEIGRIGARVTTAAIVAAGAATIAGPPGAALGAALAVVTDVSVDWLATRISKRQAQRTDAMITAARTRIEALSLAGATLRPDLEVDEQRARFAELTEAALVAARDVAQAKKARHFGFLVANIAFSPDCPFEDAHVMLRVAEQLTYRQYCLLEGFAQVQETVPWRCGHLIELAKAAPAIAAEIEGLRTHRLLQPRITFEQQIRITPLGRLLAELLCLKELEPGDLATAREIATARPPHPEEILQAEYDARKAREGATARSSG